MDGDQGGSAIAQIAGGAIGAATALNQPVPRRVAIQERASLVRLVRMAHQHQSVAAQQGDRFTDRQIDPPIEVIEVGNLDRAYHHPKKYVSRPVDAPREKE